MVRLIYNIEREEFNIVTSLHEDNLMNARKGDFINLFHYHTKLESNDFREVLNIKYNGGMKEIQLSRIKS